MKRLFPLNLIITVFILYSCSNKKDGDWNDSIKLSAKSVEFNSSSDSVIIKTGGSCWWITDISVNNMYYYVFTDVNLQADSYSIKHDCYVIERWNKNTLFIKVNENPLNVKRIITVGLEAGDYFDRVSITQKSK